MAKDYWLKKAAPTRREVHFGNRVVTCVAERPSSLNDMLRATASIHPEREAMVCGTVRYSWRELDVCVGRVAAGLPREVSVKATGSRRDEKSSSVCCENKVR